MKELDLKERQSIALDILIRFDQYCKEKGLYYTLEFGTLLGAVRHKGFIPWDDDIDVCMPREDYETLLRDKKIGEKYNIDNYGDGKEHDTNFAKIYDDSTYAIKNSGEKRCGIYIDIYPMDYLPDSSMKRLVQNVKLYYYYSATKFAEKPTRQANNYFYR